MKTYRGKASNHAGLYLRRLCERVDRITPAFCYGLVAFFLVFLLGR
jgi:hypothetical protein